MKSPVTLSTLPEGFTANQVPLSSDEQQDTLTVALESTGIVPTPDAGITEVTCLCTRVCVRACMCVCVAAQPSG